jgi:hypothetical protein
MLNTAYGVSFVTCIDACKSDCLPEYEQKLHSTKWVRERERKIDRMKIKPQRKRAEMNFCVNGNIKATKMQKFIYFFFISIFSISCSSH